jgi:hypothetical protein
MTNPVIETNIERILEDHLFHEIDKVDSRIGEMYEQIAILEARKAKLLRIAEAAGIEPNNYSSTL